MVNSFASVEVQYIRPSVENFSFKEACEKSGVSEALLINSPTLSQLDCMSKIISLREFCLSNMLAPENFSRAYAENEKKQVICQSAEGLTLSLTCKGGNNTLCSHEKEACATLQGSYAKNLKLVKATLQMDRAVHPQVSCYFLSQELAKIEANLPADNDFKSLQRSKL